MGYIRERKLKKGKIRYHAEIRLKGHPTLTASFDRMTDGQRKENLFPNTRVRHEYRTLFHLAFFSNS